MKNWVFFLVIFAAARARAQTPTCTGGLGDPIVDITFGHGTGFGGALAGGVTNMQYIASNCPEDGQYTIVHATTGCYSPTWLNVTSDHTGDPNGYFMLINASYTPSDFYVQTIGGLCPGTTYQFAAWILNMVDVSYEIQPNLTFTIENAIDSSVLATYNTGLIPYSTFVNWVQYGFFFNTPPGVNSVILIISNNQIGGNGNDLALDDITFRAAGPAILVTGSAGFSDDSITICQNDPRTILLDATVENCYATSAYQWQQSVDGGTDWTDIPGETGVAFLRTQTNPGSYAYRLVVAQAGNIGIAACEVASIPAVVGVIGIPTPAVTIAANADSSCAGSPVVFTAAPDSGGAGPVYQWLVNGVDSGTGGPTFTTSSLKSGDVVSCVMTSDAVCVQNPVVSSNDVSITVTPIPVTSVSIAVSGNNICQDSAVVFTAAPVNGGLAPAYQWMVNGSPAGGDSAVFPSSQLNNGDEVTCRMTSGLLCAVPDTSSPVTMVVYPLPQIGLNPDTVIAGGQSVRLSPLIGGTVVSYTWSPAAGLDDPGVPDPVATPLGTTTYRLMVVSDHGCVATAAEVVGVFYRLAIPEAFTPNGDGRNDIFRVPPSVPVIVRRLAVYNREGLCVYSGTGASAGWDGTYNGHVQSSGQYVWVLEWGNPLTGQVELAKGVVMLVR